MNAYSSCEEYGHIYTIPPDPEVYSSCVDCGEPREREEMATLIIEVAIHDYYESVDGKVDDIVRDIERAINAGTDLIGVEVSFDEIRSS